VLFDLQSPGRRRVIKVAYALLAGIMFVGFVGFGIGTSGSGPLEDIFGGGGGSSDPSSAFDDDINAAEDRVQQNPADVNALSQLVQLHYQAGSQQVEIDQNTGAQSLTSDGEQQLQESVDAWARYQKQAGKQIAPGTASFAVQAYTILADSTLAAAVQSANGSEALTKGQAAVADYSGAADAQQIVIDGRASSRTASVYSNLAYFLYRAGRIQEGDQAAAEARKVAEQSEQAQLEQSLKQSKATGTQLTTAISTLSKQLQKAQQTAQQTPSAGGGTNPLGGLGGGAFGTGGTGLSGGQ
jgi:hypothetical protein